MSCIVPFVIFVHFHITEDTKRHSLHRKNSSGRACNKRNSIQLRQVLWYDWRTDSCSKAVLSPRINRLSDWALFTERLHKILVNYMDWSFLSWRRPKAVKTYMPIHSTYIHCQELVPVSSFNLDRLAASVCFHWKCICHAGYSSLILLYAMLCYYLSPLKRLFRHPLSCN